MMRRLCAFGSFLIVALPAVLFAADWAQWRGPARSGVAPDAGPIAESWPDAGPRKLWESEPIPSGTRGGYGSVSVAGGRALLYVNTPYSVEITHRTITQSELQRLGRAKPALAKAVLEKLATVKNRQFETADALVAWLDENGITGEAKTTVLRYVPGKVKRYKDIILCLNAADGKTLWRTEYDGRTRRGFDASSQPTVVDGRCYVIGCNSDVYCLDVTDGKEIWTANAGGGLCHSSVLVADGRAIVQTKAALTAYDAATGAVLWTQPKVKAEANSPVLWQADGKALLLCNTPRKVFAVEPATGDVLWSVPGGEMSTPAMDGDTMVILTQAVLLAYRISPTGAEKLWQAKVKARGINPILHDGHVYVLASRQSACVNLQSGEIAWEAVPEKKGYPFGSPILVGDRLIGNIADGKLLVMVKADPRKYAELARVNLGLTACSVPAFADGKLFVRRVKSVACYDLRPPGKERE